MVDALKKIELSQKEVREEDLLRLKTNFFLKHSLDDNF